MLRRVDVLVLLCCVAGLSGCANPYSQFYQGIQDARTMPDYVPRTESLAIYSTEDFQTDVARLIRAGFWPIGEAFFNAGVNAVSEAQIRAQADKVGAHVVLVASKYSHSVSGAVPIEVPQTSNSYSTGSATAYGRSGVVTAIGSATTTTYGSQTVMMPYTVDRADFGAVFMVKIRWVLGVQVMPLDDATRRRLQSNRGAIVAIVVDDTPAFHADILPGDVLLSIAGEPVVSTDSVGALTHKHAGRTIDITLDRSGQRHTKKVTLSQP